MVDAGKPQLPQLCLDILELSLLCSLVACYPQHSVHASMGCRKTSPPRSWAHGRRCHLFSVVVVAIAIMSVCKAQFRLMKDSSGGQRSLEITRRNSVAFGLKLSCTTRHGQLSPRLNAMTKLCWNGSKIIFSPQTHGVQPHDAALSACGARSLGVTPNPSGVVASCGHRRLSHAARKGAASNSRASASLMHAEKAVSTAPWQHGEFFLKSRRHYPPAVPRDVEQVLHVESS